MSDGPTHFKNETVRRLTKGLRTHHYFTLPYCPWSNGAIERIGKELIRVARALLSELQLRHNDWPQFVPIIQSAVNNAPSPLRNNFAPITAFTGQQPSTPVSTFLKTSDFKPMIIIQAQHERAMTLTDLVTFMDQLHPMVQDHANQQRARMRSARSKGQLTNFQEGDFVLVAQDQFFEGEKLCLRWRGPRRVVKAINDFVFKVEDLRNERTEEVHALRLKFYSDSSLDEKVIMSHVFSSETGMPVLRLLRLVEEDGQLYVIVCRKGLTEADDTKEPLARIHEDVPQLVKKLLKRQSTSPELREKARTELDY